MCEITASTTPIFVDVLQESNGAPRKVNMSFVVETEEVEYQNLPSTFRANVSGTPTEIFTRLTMFPSPNANFQRSWVVRGTL